MRWPWRRRRKDSGRVVFIGTSPFDVVRAINAVPTPSPAVSAYVPEEPAAPEEEREEARAGVQLGFADGSVITLEEDDPRAVALRAAAARLTGTG